MIFRLLIVFSLNFVGYNLFAQVPEPTIQASNILFSSITTNSVTISWSDGNGGYRLVLARAVNPISATPNDGSFSYTPNKSLGVGDQIGSGNYVVANTYFFDNSSPVIVTNLSPATTYFFQVFEYNYDQFASGNKFNYLTTAGSGNPANVTTQVQTAPTIQASNLIFSNITSSSIQIAFTPGNGSNHLIVGKAGSAVDAFPTNGAAYFGSTSFGSGENLGNGNFVIANSCCGGSIDVSNLTANTQYFFRVFSYNDPPTSYNLNSNSGNPASQTTLTVEPTIQASNITFANITAISTELSFTPGNGTSRLIIARQGSSVNSDPVDGFSYGGNLVFGAGSQIGAGNYVVYNGTAGPITISGLIPNTTYHFRIYEYNGSGSSCNYRTNNATQNPRSQSTLALANQPATQASSLVLTPSTVGSSHNVSVNFTSGNGSSRLVLAKQGSAIDALPVDGTIYTSGPFGSGSELGIGNFVVGIGSAPITAIGLSPNTTYHFRVFEFNGTGGNQNYNTNVAVGNPGSTTTLFNEPTSQANNVTFSNVTANSVRVNWTNGNGSSRLVIAKEGSAVNQNPEDGTQYTGNANFSSATEIASGNKVVYRGGDNFVDITGFSPGNTYHFRVYELNGLGSQTNYFTNTATNNPNNRTTLQAEPTAQPTTLTFNTIEETSINGSFTAATDSPAGYLVLRRQGASPTGVPLDGMAYSVGNVIGDGVVVAAGSGTTFNDAGLSANTVYHYDVFAYNGSGATINYRTTSPLEGSRTTLQTEPAAQPTTLTFPTFTTSSLGGGFTAAAGSPSGYLVLRRQGASPTGVPADGTAYSAGNLVGDGTVVAVGSSTTFTETGLSTNTVYHYDIFSYNGAGAAVNYRTTSPLEGSRSTLSAEPTAQPTTLTFNTITSNSMNGSFSAAAGSPAGYLVLRNTSPISDVPVDGTPYTAGSSMIGTSSVISVGGGTTFNSAGLTSGVEYHYAVFAYNGSGVTINYRQASPLQNSQSTIVTEPTTQATNISFSGLNATSLTVSWTNGNDGTARLVVARQASAVSVNPTDGIAYTGNANFTAAADLGSGNKVVYRGTGNSVAVTNLVANTVYHFRVYELNGTGALTNYLTNTATNNPNSRTTLQTEPTAQPSDITFPTVNTTSVQGSFLAASGSPTGYLVLRRQGSAPTGSPTDGSTYSVEDQIGDGTVVSVGSGTTFNDADLAAGTVYHYKAFSYNGTGAAINYRTTNPAEKSVITVCAPPEAITPTDDVGQTSFTAAWNAAIGAADYRFDVSQDNFASFVSGFNSKEVSGLSDNVSGLTPGITYQYRVRALNASGVSANSNVISQITIPATPVAAAVTSPGSTSFTASWNTIVGATGYELDVSTNNFATYVLGFQARPIPAGTTQEFVSPLSSDTQYQYRVRAINAGGASPSSNTINVTTASGAGGLVVGTVAFSNLIAGQSSVPISVDVTGGTGAKNVKLFHKKIRSTGHYASLDMTNTSGNTFSVNLPASELDELGAEFYIRATDATAAQPTSSTRYIYNPVPNGELIPGLSFGGRLTNYRIISIPYKLDQANTPIVFSALGAYDKTQWRLLQYIGTAYSDNPNSISVGKGYWFNAREETSIELGPGTVSQNNQSQPFSMQLQQGWNMVATPYPYSINWSDVLDNNPTADVDEEYYVYTGTGYSVSDNLEPFRGGFVYANAPTTLQIPVTIGQSGGRRAQEKNISNNSDAGNWLVPLMIKYRDQENTLIGFGMHELASHSKDRFDGIALPALDPSVSFVTRHPEYFSPEFSRDVAPLQENYVWSYVLTAPDDEHVQLSWDNKPFGNSKAQVLLYDAKAGVLIDMRINNVYATKGSRTLEFIYSKDEKFTGRSELGKAYPNPFTKEVNLPAFLNTTEGPAVVSVSIKSLTGVEVYKGDWKTETLGLLQPEWIGTHSNGYPVASGVYIYQLKFSTSKQTVVTQGKILKQ